MRTNDLLGLGSVPRNVALTPVSYQKIGFSWAAVAAGVALALALSVLFAELGLALNLGLIGTDSDVKTIGIVNAIAWVIGGVLAVFAGAWVAGRVATARTTAGGALHGLAVWATAAIVTAVFAVSAAGMIGTGMVQLVGNGIEGAGKVAAIAAPDWESVKEQLQGQKGLSSDSDASAAPDGKQAGGDDRFIEESRMIELAGRHFAVEGSTLGAAERTELVTLMSARLEISPEAADRTLTQWTNVWQSGVERFEKAKADAVAVADEARAYAAAAAGWAAFAMLLCAIAAAVGGAVGSATRLRAYSLDVHPDGARVGHSPPMATEDVAGPSSLNPPSVLPGKASTIRR